jgi:hypothetical protein
MNKMDLIIKLFKGQKNTFHLCGLLVFTTLLSVEGKLLGICKFNIN